MQVIICGAGQVGFALAKYLVTEDNDVAVIDNNQELLDKVSATLDIKPVLGQASYPSILEKADAENADMIIAVTQSDEINMVACRVAHSLFNVPTKIARIRSQDYLDPLWANLYTDDNLPIDLIISPEKDVADAITRRLDIPGVIDVVPLCDGNAYFIAVRCGEMSPMAGAPVIQLPKLFPGVNMNVVGIVREDKVLVASDDETIMQEDDVYFVVDAKHIDRAKAVLGLDEGVYENIVIFGGGKIGKYLCEKIEERGKFSSCTMIEKNQLIAEKAAEELETIRVINGDVMDMSILEAANIHKCEYVVAVTDSDEVNMLSSLLAKKMGVKRTICRLNDFNYASFPHFLGIDASIDTREVTISNILQFIRKGKVHVCASINQGGAELLQAQIKGVSGIVGKTIAEIELPSSSKIGAIVRNDNEYIYPTPTTEIESDDELIIFSLFKDIKKIENLFSVGLDYF